MTAGEEGLNRTDSKQEWFYSIDGNQQTGPLEKESIQQLIQAEVLTSESLVWRRGFGTWQSIESVPELQPSNLTPINTPSSKDANENQFSPRFHPWRRGCARLVDMQCFVIITAINLNIMFEYIPQDILDTLFPSMLEFYIFIVILWIFYESLFLTYHGATPGKIMWGISVRKKDGTRMDFWTALNRTCYVLVLGEGFFIDNLTYYTQFFSYTHLRRRGTMRWDDILNLTVTHKKWSITRAIVCTIEFLLLQTLWIAGNVMNETIL